MHENYPSAGAGGQVPEPAPRGEPPTSLQTAVRLMYAGAGISAISFILGLVTIGSVRHTLEKQYPHDSAAKINSLVNAEIAIVVIAGIIGVGLWLWMAWANKRGKSWARITGTVFFGLYTLDLILVAARAASGISTVFAIVTWLVGLGATIMLWRRDSSAYINAQQQPY
jgi:FtsH-binding integral membrane protein